MSSKERQAKRRERLRLEGNCSCGRPRDLETSVCSTCLKRNREYQAKRQARAVPGEICRCGAVIDNVRKRLCVRCRKIANQTASTRSKKKLSEFITTAPEARCCIRCSRNLALIGRRECEECWWKIKGNSHFKSFQVAKDLRDIWESQGRRCALSGVPIQPPNMELDHRTPRAKGGESKLDNVQWVLPEINSAKHDLNEKRFIELCRMVVDYKSGVLSSEA